MRTREKGIGRLKYVLRYSDSEPNEVMIGLLHMAILPFAMFELGKPWALLQITAHAAGVFQLYCVLLDGQLRMRELAVKFATIISIATVANYCMAGMMRGSHLGWLLVCIMSIWNLYRVSNESMSRK